MGIGHPPGHGENAMLDQLADTDNLFRAWRWLRSNPDATYKHYFRNLYGIYAIAENTLITSLQDRLRRGIYAPANACKIFLPKSSGILRPYSLLTIEDQIVYQAATNLVAERLFPKVKHRYEAQIFGHLYAGKNSIWFYRKWSAGYRAFNDAARAAFNDGFLFAASFDLTACYDSLDHGVLTHQLKGIGCTTEFCAKLTEWLSKWTATERKIYHNHGIPQGPLSSGCLSEVVLRHFDEGHRNSKRVRYFRYVDDIRLFGKNERDLRQSLVKLDLLSKDIGLFPQASKISIHKVSKIEDELKSISHPTEMSIRQKNVDQVRLKARIVELTPRFRISNPTRFKYLLAHAVPEAHLTARIWRIFENHPEFYATLARYLGRYWKIPHKAAQQLIREIQVQELYPAVRNALLSAADGRLGSADGMKLDRFVKVNIWKPRNLPADLYASAGQRLIKSGLLTQKQLAYALEPQRPGWARSQLILSLAPMNPTKDKQLNKNLCDQNAEVAMAAAYMIAKNEVPILVVEKSINLNAVEVLREFHLIKSTPLRQCGIKTSLDRMVGRVPDIDWGQIFGDNYSEVERQAVLMLTSWKNDASTWVNAMDVFNDQLLEAIFRYDPSIGTYTLGKIGSVLQPNGRLKRTYPCIYDLVNAIHNKRADSYLSHPLNKRTGRPTQRIRYSYFRFAKGLIQTALNELEEKLKSRT